MAKRRKRSARRDAEATSPDVPLPAVDSASDEPGSTLISHLIELRDRIMKAILAVIVVFLALVYFANDIYTMLASPLLAALPKGATMIATEVASPFLTPIRLTALASLVVAMPVVLYQIWAFIAPGLYRH